METARIADIAEINPRVPRELIDSPDREVNFVPMSHLSERGEITCNGTRPVREVLKGYTYFANGDVIVAKITPCMENGKAALVRDLPCGVAFGSTEFHVLRPRERVEPRYLFYMLWNPAFRHAASQNMTGTAGQKRVPAGFIERFQVALPPLGEQKRIADILDKADAIRHEREQCIRLTEDLLRSTFLDMFGDPATNPKGWSSAGIGSLCRLVRGSSPRPKGDPRYYSGPVKRLMVEDLTRDGLEVFANVDSLTEEGARLSRPVPSGTIVLVVSGNVGLPAKLMEPACIHDGFVGLLDLDSTKVRPDYLLHTLLLIRTLHEKNKAGAIWQNLTTDQVKATKVPLPAIEQQDQFLNVVSQHRKVTASTNKIVEQTYMLFNSLAQRAFRGQL